MKDYDVAIEEELAPYWSLDYVYPPLPPWPYTVHDQMGSHVQLGERFVRGSRDLKYETLACIDLSDVPPRYCKRASSKTVFKYLDGVFTYAELSTKFDS
jgi:hypothetical protein